MTAGRLMPVLVEILRPGQPKDGEHGMACVSLPFDEDCATCSVAIPVARSWQMTTVLLAVWLYQSLEHEVHHKREDCAARGVAIPVDCRVGGGRIDVCDQLIGAMECLPIGLWAVPRLITWGRRKPLGDEPEPADVMLVPGRGVSRNQG